jgi:methionyl-tRNA formyltransferase
VHAWSAQTAERSLAEAAIAVENGRLFVGCGAGTALELLELQVEGKKRTPAIDFAHGYRPLPGEKFGDAPSSRS